MSTKKVNEEKPVEKVESVEAVGISVEKVKTEKEPEINTEKTETMEVKFYDDLNRELSEDYSGILSDELKEAIKASYVYNNIMQDDRQLVIVYDGEEIVISNEDAKELLK